jgi:hypothetical protein
MNFKLTIPPELLLEIWQKGFTIEDSIWQYCDEEYIDDHQNISLKRSNDDVGMSILSRHFELENANKNLINNLIEKIETGELIALGFKSPTSHKDSPVKIPPHIWVPENINKLKSSFFTDEVKFEKIRIIISSEIDKVVSGDKPKIPKHEKRGRPSVKAPLNKVYDKLKSDGRIEFSLNLKANLEDIQDEFLKMFPYENDGIVEYSAVHKHLIQIFREDKNKYLKSIKKSINS